MQFFVGIDVSLEMSSICIIDERGVIIKEGKAESDPNSIARFIRHRGRKVEHVGLEAGQLSEWLFTGLSEEGFKVSVLEARHVRAAFAAMRVKTDRNDARGIAQLIRLGWFKSVHVKTLDARATRAVLNARKFLVDKVTAVENTMRSALRNFGLKMGQVSRRSFAARARELADSVPCLELIIDSLLKVRDALLDQLAILDRKLLTAARADPITRMLMTAPGIGTIVALTFRSAVDDPTRFSSVKSVGPWLGLTPSRYQSGQTDRTGHITRAGDAARAESCAGVSRITPPSIGGQQNARPSSRFVSRQMPVPSHHSNFTRSTRLARNTYTAPEKGSAPSACCTNAASVSACFLKSTGMVATRISSSIPDNIMSPS